MSSCLFSRAVFSISFLVCENSPLLPLLADRDVSPQGQKFHFDDVKSVRNLFRSSFRSYIVKLLFTNNRQKYKLSQRWNVNVMNLLQSSQFSSISNVFWLLLQTHFGIAGARSPEGHKTWSKFNRRHIKSNNFTFETPCVTTGLYYDLHHQYGISVAGRRRPSWVSEEKRLFSQAISLCSSEYSVASFLVFISDLFFFLPSVFLFCFVFFCWTLRNLSKKCSSNTNLDENQFDR